jgi:hypothetical protein
MDLVERAYITWERTNQPRRYRARLIAGLGGLRRRLVKIKDAPASAESTNDDTQPDELFR